MLLYFRSNFLLVFLTLRFTVECTRLYFLDLDDFMVIRAELSDKQHKCLCLQKKIWERNWIHLLRPAMKTLAEEEIILNKCSEENHSKNDSENEPIVKWGKIQNCNMEWCKLRDKTCAIITDTKK